MTTASPSTPTSSTPQVGNCCTRSFVIGGLCCSLREVWRIVCAQFELIAHSVVARDCLRLLCGSHSFSTAVPSVITPRHVCVSFESCLEMCPRAACVCVGNNCLKLVPYYVVSFLWYPAVITLWHTYFLFYTRCVRHPGQHRLRRGRRHLPGAPHHALSLRGGVHQLHG
jgi:hypothetical protein